MKHKILLVTGDDFAAVTFECYYQGKKIADIIPNLSTQGETIEDCEISYEVVEIETEDIRKFAIAFKRMVTERKHRNFYIDTQVL